MSRAHPTPCSFLAQGRASARRVGFYRRIPPEAARRGGRFWLIILGRPYSLSGCIAKVVLSYTCLRLRMRQYLGKCGVVTALFNKMSYTCGK